VIRELSRKEYVELKPLLAIAFTLVMIVTAAIPFVFPYLRQHGAVAVDKETAELVLRNFRSYPDFVRSDWIARNFARILCLLALLAGSGAIAGEREARTLPLLYTSGVPLRSVAVVKFCVIAAWLFLVTFASTAVLTAHSLVEKLPLPVADLAVTSLVAWANAIAFLGVVFAASAFTKRTIFAALIALVAGFAIAALLRPLGLNGTAFAINLFADDGSIIWANAWVDLLAALTVMCAGLLATFVEVDRRRAT
jgi:ABC-type transport system involved in multi-copper enzyme maturation permease subunit